MAAERLFLDTNLLIAATDVTRVEHEAVVRAFNEAWPRDGVTLYTSGQVLREYLVVTTRPPTANGLGLDSRDALTNAAEFRGRMTFLEENEKVASRLGALMTDHVFGGKRIHDANIVATMLTHGVRVLITLNAPDFSAFADEIDVRGM